MRNRRGAVAAGHAAVTSAEEDKRKRASALHMAKSRMRPVVLEETHCQNVLRLR